MRDNFCAGSGVFRQSLFALLLIGLTGILAHAQDVQPGADDPLQVGNPNAPLKFEVFIDYQCPSCVPFHKQLKKVLASYPDRVLVTFRHFPISFHDKARFAAQAVEAARNQGRGVEMADLLLTRQAKWSTNPQFEKKLVGYAKEIDLDLEQYNRDINDSMSAERVNLDLERGKSLKVGSVPSVLLNGRPLSYVESMDLEQFISKGN